jgi:hypothetical protein
MTDQLPPTGPFPRPQDWPYWMPDTLLGHLPMPSVPSNDVWKMSPPAGPSALNDARPIPGLRLDRWC